MRLFILGFTLMALSACTHEDGKPTLLGNTFCGMRESACQQRCKTMDAQQAIACRRSCEDSGRDKCG